MLNTTTLLIGNEQHEKFKMNGKQRVQYDYRDIDGELFSCVKNTLGECRAARDRWLDKKNNAKLEQLITDMEKKIKKEGEPENE